MRRLEPILRVRLPELEALLARRSVLRAIRDAEVARLHDDEGLSYAEIARRVRLSRARIGQVYERAMRARLRAERGRRAMTGENWPPSGDRDCLPADLLAALRWHERAEARWLARWRQQSGQGTG